ncbi:hypothetical protein M0812_09377 [Anaeramoeba flamelloides]|uniref:Uncharacterized protein n=1 Tax=Anaeramoeba flamelloides TaxID=1746091 RepID=A0AAV7ZNF8_9EUKA|nr:hypothetical protein M0812_09377 [Anaeramoeba flamelloides]
MISHSQKKRSSRKKKIQDHEFSPWESKKSSRTLKIYQQHAQKQRSLFQLKYLVVLLTIVIIFAILHSEGYLSTFVFVFFELVVLFVFISLLLAKKDPNFQKINSTQLLLLGLPRKVLLKILGKENGQRSQDNETFSKAHKKDKENDKKKGKEKEKETEKVKKKKKKKGLTAFDLLVFDEQGGSKKQTPTKNLVNSPKKNQIYGSNPNSPQTSLSPSQNQIFNSATTRSPHYNKLRTPPRFNRHHTGSYTHLSNEQQSKNQFNAYVQMGSRTTINNSNSYNIKLENELNKRNKVKSPSSPLEKSLGRTRKLIDSDIRVLSTNKSKKNSKSETKFSFNSKNINSLNVNKMRDIKLNDQDSLFNYENEDYLNNLNYDSNLNSNYSKYNQKNKLPQQQQLQKNYYKNTNFSRNLNVKNENYEELDYDSDESEEDIDFNFSKSYPKNKESRLIKQQSFTTWIKKSGSNPNSQLRQSVSKYLPSRRKNRDVSEEQHSTHLALSQLRQLNLSEERVSEWVEKLKRWVTPRIFLPHVRYIEDINRQLAKNEVTQCLVFEQNTSLNGYRSQKSLFQSESDNRENKRKDAELIRQTLENNKNEPIIQERTKLFNMFKIPGYSQSPEYAINRITELAASGRIIGFKWNSGGSWYGRPFKSYKGGLPPDAILFAHLINLFLGTAQLEDFVRFEKTPVEQVRSVAVVLKTKNPPHFVVICKQKLWHIIPGSENVFHAFVLFLYAVKKHFHGMLGDVSLENGALDMLSIFK